MIEYSKAQALDPMLGAEHEQAKLNELMTKLEHALKTSRKHPSKMLTHLTKMIKSDENFSSVAIRGLR